MNPPYGERISTPNLLGTYKMIGERFKKAFAGNEAWVLSYREECFEQIGLKPSIKIPVFNGSLECEFRKYVMFDGKMKDFRSEGGIVKTDSEKREMAQKHRFKKEREFKKRITEETENEEDDIRSFKFHTSRFADFEKTARTSVVATRHVRQDAATTTTMKDALARVSREATATSREATVTSSVEEKTSSVEATSKEVARTSSVEENVASITSAMRTKSKEQTKNHEF